jgi:hypothetical protein
VAEKYTQRESPKQVQYSSETLAEMVQEQVLHRQRHYRPMFRTVSEKRYYGMDLITNENGNKNR